MITCVVTAKKELSVVIWCTICDPVIPLYMFLIVSLHNRLLWPSERPPRCLQFLTRRNQETQLFCFKGLKILETQLMHFFMYCRQRRICVFVCAGVCVCFYSVMSYKGFRLSFKACFFVSQQKKQTKATAISHQFHLLLTLLQVLLHIACDSTEGRSGLSPQ